MPKNFSLSHTNSPVKERNGSRIPESYGAFSLGATRFTPAPSAKAIRDATGTTTDGNYWIRFPNGQAYEVYCLMSSGGGGWMNINTTFGQYTGVIFNASSGAGSRNMVGSVSGGATDVFVGPYVTHNQAAECGNCSGGNCPSRIGISNTMVSEMGITEFRMQGRVSSQPAGGSCPQFRTFSVSTNVAGTNYNGCPLSARNPPTLGPVVDMYGPATADYIVYAISACNGSSPWTGRVEGLYVR